jgi:hypothetical protein
MLEIERPKAVAGHAPPDPKRPGSSARTPCPVFPGLLFTS